MRICGFNKTTLLDYPGKVVLYFWVDAISAVRSVRMVYWLWLPENSRITVRRNF